MPRKSWVPKNRFCKKSKLDSSEFGALVQYYFREGLFSEPRDLYHYDFVLTCHYNDIAESIPDKNFDDGQRIRHIFNAFDNSRDKEYYRAKIKELEFKKKPITIKSFNSNFSRIGQCIWEREIVDLHPSFQEKDVFDDLIDLIYGKTEQISSYQDLYFNFLSNYPLYLTEENIFRSRMFHLLSKRSKVTRGFKKEAFYLEFSRVYFLCEIIEKTNIKLRSLDSIKDEYKLREIVFPATVYFLAELVENPM